MSAIAGMRQEWKKFRHAPPGKRFRQHHERMQHQPRWQAVVRIGLGVALLLAGIAMLFVPGPGVLVMVFGLGLIAGQSGWLAGVLDRVEPKARARARAVARWWRHLPGIGKVGVTAVAAGVVALAVLAVWRLWLAG